MRGGTRSDKRGYKPTRYPERFGRPGQPNTCGVIDPETGDECKEPSFEHPARCEYHQMLHEKWPRREVQE